jgi:hypothetical protein
MYSRSLTELEEVNMLRKFSHLAAVAAVLAMPVGAMAAGHGGHGGGMHLGAAGMHMGGAGRSFGHVNTFRSATFFHGRHAFVGRHFRHHRRLFAGGFGIYGYDSCYRHVLTPWGWRWRWVCGYDYL